MTLKKRNKEEGSHDPVRIPLFLFYFDFILNSFSSFFFEIRLIIELFILIIKVFVIDLEFSVTYSNTINILKKTQKNFKFCCFYSI